VVKEKLEPLPTWRTFAFELLIYAVLVVSYFFLVLHYLSDWFKDLFDHDRRLFAVMALVVMIGQTVVLEVISSSLVWVMRKRKT
jgi:Kef-type K+ transport system membrane component KefB